MMSDTTKPSDQPTAAATQQRAAARLSANQRLIRGGISALVVIAFFTFGYWGTTQFLAMHWLGAFVGFTSCFMTIPFALHDDPLRDRIAYSLIMPFGVGGIGLGVLALVGLMYLPGSELYLNNDAFPLWLLTSTTLGFIGGAYIGARIIAWLHRDSMQRS